MRTRASILHLDLDAFFAAVEQRDKPSLRGKPVIVGGVGPRGVVSTASYEARRFGVGSAMAMAEARRRCPHAAFLSGRFGAYRDASRIVMALLGELSPRVEPLSLDEAFVDLEAGEPRPLDDGSLLRLAEELRTRLTEATGGLTASVGLGSSKFIAKVASELAKPDGVRLVLPGSEVDTIAPLSARAVPGVGPATMERLARLGVETIADLQRLTRADLVRELGRSAGEHLHDLVFARDDRAVEPERETKSISVEDTFERDIVDPETLAGIAARQAAHVVQRLTGNGLFARTVTLKVRRPDFTSVTRSRTLDGATGRLDVVARMARDLLAGLDVTGGVRLLGVGVSGLVEVAQEPLFDLVDPAAPAGRVVEESSVPARRAPGWHPGADVIHDAFGSGWVWGTGLGRVTVRFETADTPPGPVRTFSIDDPALRPADGSTADGAPPEG
ncbi:DNA polymerase IV [Propionicicella superfundia]|uniref:DNA polymerase IV n=1 Tax=Propionicicella superfundia TaxID=348582 RepID=UPI00040AB8E4|nr:DNA polymerase IV [Propionicicella superfundia]